jgi:hypothetical protein
MTTVFTDSRGQQVLSITQNGGTLTFQASAADSVFIRSVDLVGDFRNFKNFSKVGEFTTPTISLDGKTLTFVFTTSNSGGGAKRFNESDSFGFDFGGNGVGSATSVIQGFPWGAEKITGQLAVPEPGVGLVGAIGLILLLLRRR